MSYIAHIHFIALYSYSFTHAVRYITAFLRVKCEQNSDNSRHSSPKKIVILLFYRYEKQLVQLDNRSYNQWKKMEIPV